jgi:hypothetical protein
LSIEYHKKFRQQSAAADATAVAKKISNHEDERERE